MPDEGRAVAVPHEWPPQGFVPERTTSQVPRHAISPSRPVLPDVEAARTPSDRCVDGGVLLDDGVAPDVEVEGVLVGPTARAGHEQQRVLPAARGH
jgi:hypothetical protein